TALKSLPSVVDVTRTGAHHNISLKPGSDPGEAIREIVNAVPASRVELHRPTLEDIFVQIVTEGGNSDLSLENLRAGLRRESAAGEAS
ncbi:MAG: hypothetical protein DRJ65_03425, partial [Acidobacteria bacterium]